MDSGQYWTWVSMELFIRTQGRGWGPGGSSLHLRLSTAVALMLYEFYAIIIFFIGKWMGFGCCYLLCRKLLQNLPGYLSGSVGRELIVGQITQDAGVRLMALAAVRMSVG